MRFVKLIYRIYEYHNGFSPQDEETQIHFKRFDQMFQILQKEFKTLQVEQNIINLGFFFHRF